MANFAISVQNVSKKFSKTIKHTMLYGATDLMKAFTGLNSPVSHLRSGEFWAVNDVSFELRQGEAIGLIGSNGAGKSTMLKMLNGIYMPDIGAISIRGRMGALIEVGAGFHPMLTGRENIFINGTILGMTRNDIARKLDSIIDFAGIGDFIDAPVKHYSSGMFVRLGFAIAAHCKPDILLIDEVLAVGDANFKRKCLNHLAGLQRDGVTFVIVSHNMQTIEGITEKALFFHHGRIAAYGKTGDVISRYELQSLTADTAPKPIEQSSDPNALSLVKTYHGYGTSEISIEKMVLYDSAGSPSKEFRSDDSLTVEVSLKSPASLKTKLCISFINQHDAVCLGTYKILDISQGTQKMRILFDKVQLTTGTYKIAFHLFDTSHTNPYFNGHFGYFTMRKEGAVVTPGLNTPHCWAYPTIKIVS